jgi:hypothetical protein
MANFPSTLLDPSILLNRPEKVAAPTVSPTEDPGLLGSISRGAQAVWDTGKLIGRGTSLLPRMAEFGGRAIEGIYEDPGAVGEWARGGAPIPPAEQPTVPAPIPNRLSPKSRVTGPVPGKTSTNAPSPVDGPPNTWTFPGGRVTSTSPISNEQGVLGRGTMESEVTMPKGPANEPTLPGWHTMETFGDMGGPTPSGMGVITPRGSLSEYLDAKYGKTEPFDPDKARIEEQARATAVTESENARMNAEAEQQKIRDIAKAGGIAEYEAKGQQRRASNLMDSYATMLKGAQDRAKAQEAQLRASMPANTPEERAALAKELGKIQDDLDAYGRQAMLFLLQTNPSQNLPSGAYGILKPSY